jgi:hypothetical protein
LAFSSASSRYCTSGDRDFGARFRRSTDLGLAWACRDCAQLLSQERYPQPLPAGQCAGIGHISKEAAMVLTPEQVAKYRYDGYLYPVPALSPDEIAEHNADLARFEEWLGKPVNQGDWRWRSAAYVFLPWLYRLVRHPGILDASSRHLPLNQACGVAVKGAVCPGTAERAEPRARGYPEHGEHDRGPTL